ncbi:hypothetical protein BY996DRAFT_6533191 [Phakopsora pachyrhizi]|uniref:Uncharacterized protein n=1 Tax=Phakopsora pachyrhizi TaxID=170000 RepID=A0AAV0B4N3_PHAPC|nr:hypothetical protein BY996DRAFT_6533191 [Phakopsora pachyrhizi]CAH7681546.1 hypothetical protein PPACK8108_LOCUS14164 [Phakopsora pachyrhizi]
MVVVDLDDAEPGLYPQLDVLCCDLSGIVVVEADGNGEEGNNEQFGDEGASKRDFCRCDIKDTFEHVEG